MRSSLLHRASGSVLARGCALLRSARSPPASHRWSASLDPYHTHHLLIESGWQRKPEDKNGPWGGEQHLRAAVERELSMQVHTSPLPSCSPSSSPLPSSPLWQVHAHVVQLVVQGGPGTLDLVARVAQEGTPIVAIVDTGGAALALHRVVVGGEDALAAAMETFGIQDPANAARHGDALRSIRDQNEGARAPNVPSCNPCRRPGGTRMSIARSD